VLKRRANGPYHEIHDDNPKFCVLVLMGVDEQGKTHLFSIECVARESTRRWREDLFNAKAGGNGRQRWRPGMGPSGSGRTFGAFL